VRNLGELSGTFAQGSHIVSPFSGGRTQRQPNQRGAGQHHQQQQPEPQGKEDSTYIVYKLSHIGT
jgi:hypothetical protein